MTTKAKATAKAKAVAKFTLSAKSLAALKAGVADISRADAKFGEAEVSRGKAIQRLALLTQSIFKKNGNEANFVKAKKRARAYFTGKVNKDSLQTMLTIAFPENAIKEAKRDGAIADGLTLEQVKLASRGSLTKLPSGKWKQTGKRKVRQSGSGEKVPKGEVAKKVLHLINAYVLAKLDQDWLAVAISECCDKNSVKIDWQRFARKAAN